ncbi:MAG: adenylate/guanylate cyclase [Ignavibacteria bacterium]|nr:adenylate/guanylate cyclase [Ignavibacteria bacterium]
MKFVIVLALYLSVISSSYCLNQSFRYDSTNATFYLLKNDITAINCDDMIKYYISLDTFDFKNENIIVDSILNKFSNINDSLSSFAENLIRGKDSLIKIRKIFHNGWKNLRIVNSTEKEQNLIISFVYYNPNKLFEYRDGKIISKQVFTLKHFPTGLFYADTLFTGYILIQIPSKDSINLFGAVGFSEILGIGKFFINFIEDNAINLSSFLTFILIFLMVLFFYINTGEKLYLYYLFYVFMTIVTYLTVSVFIFDFVANIPFISDQSVLFFLRICLFYIAIGITVICVWFFIKEYLQIKKYFRKLYFIIYFIFILSSINTILAGIFYNYQNDFLGNNLMNLFTYMAFLGVILTIIISIKLLKKGIRSAIFILTGWSPFILIILYIIYSNFDKSEYWPLSIHPIKLAIPFFTFEMLVFLYGIAYRTKEIKRELDKKIFEQKQVELERQFEQKEKELTELLLLNILPAPIAARLKEGEKPIADHYDEASVVFIDIVDFTKMSDTLKVSDNSRTPEQIVELLNEIYTKFDNIAEKYGIEKIKTIGDCYMAAAGVPVPGKDHAEVAARFALEAMNGYRILGSGYSEMENEEQSPTSNTQNPIPETLNIQFRCGIDCGPVVAGVIGEKKFIFDLWGDTVNTAARMEEYSEPGRIQVTERFMEKLRMKNYELRIDFVERGEIEIKGKGKMRTYFLNSITV